MIEAQTRVGNSRRRSVKEKLSQHPRQDSKGVQDSKQKTAISQKCAAECAAISDDDSLALVNAVWPMLTPGDKAAVMAIVTRFRVARG
jgi:hypothetical protein